jgi:hypothetical protein
MRRLKRAGVTCTLFTLALLAATVPGGADHPAAATNAELRALRTEVNRLDDSLRTLEDDHPRAAEFREREVGIREDLTWLGGEIRRHQRDESQGLGATKTEVEKLRREIGSLRNDIIDAAYDVPSSRGEVDVPDGTEIQVRLEETLTSKTARVEDRVAASVSEPVTVDGRRVIPAGAEVRGVVQSVDRAQRPSKGGRLELAFDSLAVNGRRVSMDARVVRLSESGLDKSKAGLGAIIGGVLGAVIDGGKGALIGAIVGGTGAVVASSGDEVELPAGTILTIRLERPLAVARR